MQHRLVWQGVARVLTPQQAHALYWHLRQEPELNLLIYGRDADKCNAKVETDGALDCLDGVELLGGWAKEGEGWGVRAEQAGEAGSPLRSPPLTISTRRSCQRIPCSFRVLACIPCTADPSLMETKLRL